MAEKDRTATSQFSVQQTQRLLALAALPSDQDQSWLIEAGDSELLGMLLTDMCQSRHSGMAVIRAVCSPDTPVEILREVKDLAKRLATDAKDQRRRGAAGLLYHLTMASAFAYHQVNLSSVGAAPPVHLYHELVEGISDDALVRVFEKAIERLAEAS